MEILNNQIITQSLAEIDSPFAMDGDKSSVT